MLEHSLIPYTKINSEWFKGLNIRHDTIKPTEQNIGKTFSKINRSNIFLAQCLKAKEIKGKKIRKEKDRRVTGICGIISKCLIYG